MKKQTRNGLIIAVVAIAAFAAFNLFKKKSGGAGAGAGTGANTGGTGTGGGGSQLDFRSLANQLFDAFEGYGTKNSKVMEIFKLLKSDADFDALKAAYGVREVSSGRFNPLPNFEGDLASTIRDEMSEDEVSQINQILTSNNISRSV